MKPILKLMVESVACSRRLYRPIIHQLSEFGKNKLVMFNSVIMMPYLQIALELSNIKLHCGRGLLAFFQISPL